ncbi:MAG: DUF4244 domain-containing protein [Acidimicrobiia bacterium]|nr:DUF4244 domain-containing protein [Acidimicrobiia bacterium]
MENVLARIHSDERGQSTVEYFLVILAASALAVILIMVFANQDQGIGGFIADLLGNVFGWIPKIFH